MKKWLGLLLCAALLLSCTTVSFAANDVTIQASSYVTESGIRTEGDAVNLPSTGNYVGYAAVDLTGIKSISVVADCSIAGGDNGDALRVKIDDINQGQRIATIIVHDQDSKDKVYSANLTASISGSRKLFLQSSFGSDSKVYFKKIILSKETVPEIEVVPDSAIIDNYADTWQATDALGRRVADYAEAGDVKDGLHEVGIFYWLGGVYDDGKPNAIAVNAGKIIAANPDAKDDYYHPVWPESYGRSGAYFWGRPLFGYYTKSDYWVYRRHAELLADSGVDFLLFDWSNGQQVMWNSLSIIYDAFLDAKSAGVNVPEFSCLGPWGGGDVFMRAVYDSILREPAYADLWYNWRGKPVVMTGSLEASYTPGDDWDMNDMMEDIYSGFTYRGNGFRGTGDVGATGNWNWLQNYPQTKWGTMDDGRVECVPVGTAINHSYEYEYQDNGAFSDPYTKGRAYSEAFGEDFREGAMNTGYFFREQVSRALDADPALVLLDGWNEWQNGRQKTYSNMTNVFVDTYDEDNSRDFEPSAGALRDDYYNAMADFIRKYKGVRPAPVASAPVTIDINGAASQWDAVTPAYVNIGGTYERNSYGYIDQVTDRNEVYKTTMPNTITGAKVARDANNFYFTVTTEKAIVKDSSFMHLYIDIDRNRATGWEGYDFSVNLTGEGVLAATADGSAWSYLADVPTAIADNRLTVSIPRALLSETGTAEFEFKWADGASENGDLLRFYEFGSVAPKGRFNYLYTEVAETTLDAATRKRLDDTAVVSAGLATMNVEGGRQYVYEPDIRVTAKEDGGVVYVPAFAAEEILGYGITKVEYYPDTNMLFVKHHTLTEATITDYVWSYTTVGSGDVRVNGRAGTLSAPAKIIDGIPYLPVTYFADVFGWKLTDISGAVVISAGTPDLAAANLAAAQLK